MFKGFYNLTSGMLTQGRNLNVIANNMTNLTTSGYKSDTFTSQTFDEVMWDRVGNKNKDYQDIGMQSYATVPSQSYTDFTQGGFDQTGMPLDFAIEGDGFFAVETEDGQAYTRSGSFSLDGEGYLCVPGQGRVLSSAGDPIMLYTDKITCDTAGNIYNQSGGYLGQLGVYVFEDNGQLEKNPQGLFTSEEEGQPATAKIHHKMVERSNVDMLQEMTRMMSSQRAYQSAAQVAKIYDSLMQQAATDVGRL